MGTRCCELNTRSAVANALSTPPGEYGRKIKLEVKALGSTRELLLRLASLNPEEGSGIPSVEVKFVDIGKNASGEGDYLVWH